MNPIKTIVDHLRQAPISLLFSVLALTLFGLPELGSHVEFRFADCHLPDLRTAFRQTILGGVRLTEWRNCFRLMGCNWLHWSADHLFWDVLMFYSIGSLCERRYGRDFGWTILLSAVLIPISVLVTTPELHSYRGLSGVDTALFALLATHCLLNGIRQRDWASICIFLGLMCGMIAKIAYEMITQQTLFVSDSTFTPVPIAHSAGALIGICVALLANVKSIVGNPTWIARVLRSTERTEGI